jgi:hypothetical protein
MTTEQEIWATLDTLCALLEAKGARREDARLMSKHDGIGPGYGISWVDKEHGGETTVVSFGDSRTKAREQAWQIIRVLHTIPAEDKK